jgi:hypothetical protein
MPPYAAVNFAAIARHSNGGLGPTAATESRMLLTEATPVSIGRQRQANPMARRRSLSASGAFAQERSELTDDANVQAA